MFDDQETHYPVPGETPWERLRYLATNTETIYPVPPYAVSYTHLTLPTILLV